MLQEGAFPEIFEKSNVPVYKKRFWESYKKLSTNKISNT